VGGSGRNPGPEKLRPADLLVGLFEGALIRLRIAAQECSPETRGSILRFDKIATAHLAEIPTANEQGSDDTPTTHFANETTMTIRELINALQDLIPHVARGDQCPVFIDSECAPRNEIGSVLQVDANLWGCGVILSVGGRVVEVLRELEPDCPDDSRPPVADQGSGEDR